MDLTGLKLKYPESCAPSGSSRRKCVFLPFPALEAACVSWLSASFSHSKTNRAASSKLPLTLSLLFPLYKHPRICKKPTQIIGFNLPTQEPYLDLICKARLPWKVTYYKFQTGSDRHLGAVILSTMVLL